jgi:hypothetical protein
VVTTQWSPVQAGVGVWVWASIEPLRRTIETMNH